MAVSRKPRLNLIGLLSILVGVAAFIAPHFPNVGYDRTFIGWVGVGIGLLGLFIAIAGVRWGSGIPVLGVLVSLSAVALASYESNGLVAHWAAKFSRHGNEGAVVPATANNQQPGAAAPSAVPADSQSPAGPTSIFNDRGGRPSPSPAVSPSSSHDSTPTPAIASPAPAPAPAIIRPAVPNLAAAQAQFDAIDKAIPASLEHDPAYLKAKADLAVAEAAVKTAQADSDASLTYSAAQKKMEARRYCESLEAAARQKDPAWKAAKQKLDEAKKANRVP